MRNYALPAWMTGLLLLLAAGTASAQETPRAILERAIKAHGGEERLSRVRADKVRLQGKLVMPGKDGPVAVPFTAETTVQLPSQFKNVVELNVSADRKFTLVQILNGDKGYVTLDGQPQKLEPAALAEMRETMYVDRAVRLVPLLTDNGHELGALGEVKVNERPALGIKVSAKGRKDLRLFFDKETALLVKTEHILEDGMGKEVRQEGYYSDFKDLGGYRRPTKVAAFRDGKKVMEAELLDVKYFDKIDDAEFSKP